MMSTEPIIESLHEIVGDLEIPCDYDDRFHCGPAAAHWEMTVRCGCGLLVTRLACGGCKNIWVATEEAAECPQCSEVYMPARRAFSLIKWLR